MFWSIGVISNLYPSSPVKVPCSAYSVSMDLVLAVNFWDAGPEAIGEDMHMYLKCYFSTAGRVIVKSIFSPASQCNIEGTGTGVSGFVSGLSARYTQSKRHLWGTLDFGYCLRRTITSYLSPDSECVVRLKNAHVSKSGHDFEERFQIAHLATMFHRMLEAHIFMGQFLTLVMFSSLFFPQEGSLIPAVNAYLWSFISSSPLHPTIAYALGVGYYLRTICMIPSAMTFFFYEKYHDWVGFGRWEAQAKQQREDCHVKTSTCVHIDTQLFASPKVQHLGKRSQLSSRRRLVHVVDWFVTPIAGLMFYVAPQYHAQLTHLWTDRLDYITAAKPKVDYAPLHDAHSFTQVPIADNTAIESSFGTNSGSSTQYNASPLSERSRSPSLNSGRSSPVDSHSGRLSPNSPRNLNFANISASKHASHPYSMNHKHDFLQLKRPVSILSTQSDEGYYEESSIEGDAHESP
jgi:Glycosyl transferase family group 2